jgi:hypothetical protein
MFVKNRAVDVNEEGGTPHGRMGIITAQICESPELRTDTAKLTRAGML